MGKKRIIPPHLEGVVAVMHYDLGYSYREIAARMTALGVRGQNGQPVGHQTIVSCVKRFGKLPGESQMKLSDRAKALLVKSVEQKQRYVDEEDSD
jgi:transposase